LGHEQTSRHVRVMSVILFKADIHQRGLHVRLVPGADSEIEARDASRLRDATEQAAEALASRFGSRHIDGRIRAFVITAIR
jgi:hypothetical protein